jgi:hypothetical protein
MVKTTIRISLAILTLTLTSLAIDAKATNYYCSTTSQGSANGTSWGNSWSCSSVPWGSVHGGDTVFMDGGTTSMTYNSRINITNSGTSDGARITLRIGQDAGHNGIATLTGGINFTSQNYVTIDGEYNGARHISLVGNGIDMPVTTSPVVRYVSLSRGAGIDANYGWHGLISHIYLTDGTGDRAIGFVARNNKDGPNEVKAYDDVIVEYSTIILCASSTEDGSGADGIQGCPGLTVRYSTFDVKTSGCTVGTNHMDFIQSQAYYISVYGNTFRNSADSAFDYDCYNGTDPNHFRIFNNVFIKNRGGAAIRFYPSGGQICTSYDNIHINNNTIVDRTGALDNAINIKTDSNANVTNSEIKNNVFYNDSVGDSLYISPSSGWTAANWNIDYNNISGGSGGMDIDGNSYTQAHPSTCTPSFAGYVYDSLSSDLHPSSSDTCIKDHGTPLSSLFTTDKDGNPRGTAWDIGAYESGFASSGGAPSGLQIIQYGP